MDRLDRVSRKYSLVLLINVDKTRVMASDSIACHILIQYELLEQVDTFLYLGSLITENGECTTQFRTRLNRGQVIGASLKKIWKSHSISISTKIWLIKALVWPVATYGCESWTRRRMKKHVLTPEMKGLRKILQVSWTAKKTNEWVLNKAGVEGTVRHRQSMVATHTMSKQGSCLEKEIMRGTVPTQLNSTQRACTDAGVNT